MGLIIPGSWVRAPPAPPLFALASRARSAGSGRRAHRLGVSRRRHDRRPRLIPNGRCGAADRRPRSGRTVGTRVPPGSSPREVGMTTPPDGLAVMRTKAYVGVLVLAVV